MPRSFELLLLLLLLPFEAAAFDSFGHQAERVDRASVARELQKAVQPVLEQMGLTEYGSEHIECAACDAMALAIETEMRRGKHLSDIPAAAEAALYSACDLLPSYFPQRVPDEPGGALNFVAYKGTQAAGMPGLAAFCSEVVEAHEEEIVALIKGAEKVEMSGQAFFGLQQKLCVQTAHKCSDEALNHISYGRMAMGAKTRPDEMRKLMEQMGEQAGLEKPSEGKAKAAAAKGKPKTGGGAKKSKGRRAEAKGPPKEEEEEASAPESRWELYARDGSRWVVFATAAAVLFSVRSCC